MASKTTPLVSDAVEQYIQLRNSDSAPTTAQTYRSALRRMAAHVGRRQIHRLEAHHLESFFIALRARNSPASVNAVRGRLITFLGYCRRRGWITADLLGDIRPQKVQARSRLQLSAVELLHVLASAEHPRDRAMIATAINTGCRASELVGLTVRSVDFDAGRLALNIRKTGQVDLFPISADLESELRRWLGWYATHLAERGGSLCGGMRLFPAKAANRYGWEHGLKGQHPGRLKPQTRLASPHLVVTRAMCAAGWEGPLKGEGFHTIRRSAGRLYFDWIAAQGHDTALRETSALLHHACAATTELYLGLSLERGRRDARITGKPFLSDMIGDRSEVIDIKRKVGNGNS